MALESILLRVHCLRVLGLETHEHRRLVYDLILYTVTCTV